MKSNRWGAVAAAALAMALVLPVTPAGAAPLPPPDRIDLPNGWQPEGITSQGKYLYTGSLADGAIWRANSRKWERRRAGTRTRGSGRGRRGLRQVPRPHLVAGGATKKVRVHDARTGQLLETYRFRSDEPSVPQRHRRDQAGRLRDRLDEPGARRRPVRLRRRLRTSAVDVPPSSDARTLPLTGDLEYEEGFNLNGIVRSGGRLVTIQSNTGLLFTVNQRTGDTHTIDLGDGLLTQGDGLEIDGDILYAVRNRLNLIAVVDLEDDLASGEVVAELTSDDFDVPTTVTLVRDSLWAVNARFGTEATPETPYWITRVDEYAGR